MTDEKLNEAYDKINDGEKIDLAHRELWKANLKKLADMVDNYIYETMVKERDGQRNKQ